MVCVLLAVSVLHERFDVGCANRASNVSRRGDEGRRERKKGDERGQHRGIAAVAISCDHLMHSATVLVTSSLLSSGTHR
jgi:hypothetical protein